VNLLRKLLRKLLIYLLLPLFILLSLYILCLCHPEPFFAYHIKYENLRLNSDRPIPKEAAAILQETQRRLLKSPIYNPKINHRIFICNDLRRFAFFATYKYRVGGLNYELFNHNAFLRNANIAHNRLIGPSGNEVPGERNLTYFITHEIVHGVIEAKTGAWAYYLQLPTWIKDGYCDYVGKDSFDFQENLAKFKTNNREMNPEKSGLYLRYHLFVAYLLDVREISVVGLLENKYDAAKIAAELIQMQ
jgi:hypothetical protein